jgi:hypothetical protein
LGDAYYNQQQDVMDAVQVMRRKRKQPAILRLRRSKPSRRKDSAIDIEPADPDVVYVPAYDPWLVYGYPVVAWPGWYPYPGIWFGGPYLSFGLGFGIGWWGGFGWGWGHWGFDWHNHYAVCLTTADTTSRSTTFYNRNNFYRGGGAARRSFNRPGSGPRPSTEIGQAPEDTLHRAAERRPLRRLQRLRPWRTGQELFVARKRQLRWWRSFTVAAVDFTAVVAGPAVIGGFGMFRSANSGFEDLKMERSHMQRTS